VENKREYTKIKGVITLEFALVFPMFLVLIFGVMDFGRLFFAYHTLQYATREGARLAMVGYRLQDEGGNELTRLESIIKIIKENASLAVDPDGLSISIFPVDEDYGDPEGWEGITDPGRPGDIMRIRVRYTYQFITPLIANFFTDGKVIIQAETTYKNEPFRT